MQLNIPACPPFSFRAVVGSHGWAQLQPFSWDEGSGVLHYILGLDHGTLASLSIREGGDGILVRVEPSLKASEQKELEEKLGWMFGLAQDFASFYTLASQESGLAHVEKRALGRVLRCGSIFEDALKTMLTTNTSWSGTIRMVETLVALYGEPLLKTENGDTQRAFPPADRLAALTEEILRQDARLGYRAPYVLELSRRVASGELDLEAFKTSDLPTAELRKQLLAIKGIGGYAAANLLMILGRYDFLPIDSWALSQVSKEWFGGNPVQPADVEKAFEKWGEWKGLVYWFWDWQHQAAA